ncbi:MAG: hypothetical protein OEV64_13005 [Desulfobulbaceae bacterium]|nr:hypothetical protein [Desulfobulbaceae bacterium]
MELITAKLYILEGGAYLGGNHIGKIRSPVYDEYISKEDERGGNRSEEYPWKRKYW